MVSIKKIFFIFVLIQVGFRQPAQAGTCQQPIADLAASVGNMADSNCREQKYQNEIKSLLNEMNSRPNECLLDATIKAREKILAGLMALLMDSNYEECKKNLKESLKLLPKPSIEPSQIKKPEATKGTS